MSDTQKQATLVFVRGLPGSGKSTIVDAAVKLFPEDSCVVLDPDATDYESDAYIIFCNEQKEQGVDEVLWPYRYLRAQSTEAIRQGKTIFWNQAFTNLESFKNVVNRHYEIAESHSVDLEVLVVEVNSSPEVAQKRISERVAQGGHDVASEKFKNFVSDYRTFSDEGFRVYSLNGEDDVKKNASLLHDEVHSLQLR